MNCNVSFCGFQETLSQRHHDFPYLLPRGSLNLYFPLYTNFYKSVIYFAEVSGEMILPCIFFTEKFSSYTLS